MADTGITEDEARFRDELRMWLEANLPREAPPEDEAERRVYQRAWQNRLADAGYVGIHWPVEYGGRAAGLNEQVIFSEEMARARSPEILDAVAVNIVGSVLIAQGNEAQKARHLQRIRRGDEVWCLGFSEPNAGSDLASLTTKAVRDGDHFVITGQKVWSSKAHFADWILLLARTDPTAPKHKGLSALIVDMHAPGVTWRPLVQISGRREFNELFLEEVRVPVENLIGPQGRGWPIIREALAHERGTLWAFDFKIRLQNGARALIDLYRQLGRDGGGRGSDVRTLRGRVAQAYIEAEVFAAHTMRTLPTLQGSKDGSMKAALQKLFGSEIQQRTQEIGMELMGSYGNLARDPRAYDGGEWYETYLYSKSVTISSGASEVLRNMIAQQGLGLPRD
jgi:alkylation response protein AidB-like acyl-CoA dehydrogenase